MICNTDLGNICIIKLGFGVQTREFWDLESEVFAKNLKLQMGEREGLRVGVNCSGLG